MSAAVFDIDGESLGYQETEPVECLRVETCFGESILPIWDAKMHDHETEVVSERVGDVEPVTREVLEPNLWLLVAASIHQCQPSIFHV